jgi:hypothetical protein
MKLIKVLGILLVVLIAVYFVAGYFLGNLPIASNIFGTNKPRDLGITLSTENAFSGLSALNHPTTTTELQAIVDDPSTFTTVKTSLTDEQASSMISMTDFPIKLVQIKFGDDGKIETSGIINTRDLQQVLGGIETDNDVVNTVLNYVNKMEWIIFYASGECSIHNNDVSLAIDKIEFGRIGIPGTIRDQLQNNIGSVENFVSKTLTSQGFNIRELSVSNGKMNLDMDRPLSSMGPWLDFIE